MKKFVIAAAAMLALTGMANAAPVRLATEGLYEPWNFVDANGNLAGLDIDVGNELCKRANLECTWVSNDWDSIIPNLVAGNYDAILAGMSITEERMQTIDFTSDYSPPEPSRYLVLTESTADLAAPKGLKIGAQTGTIQSGWLEANAKADNTIVTFADAPGAMADLRAGNIDAILADSSYLAEAVAGSEGAVKVDGPEIKVGGGVGIGVRKGDAIKATLDEALAAAKADGTIDALITKWFPERMGPFYK